ncbi:MAG: segregation/condensation protein A [Vicinamibacteria bacterium]|nr:segregation/condensation protein A [Vicinamibacteria bacterium]
MNEPEDTPRPEAAESEPPSATEPAAAPVAEGAGEAAVEAAGEAGATGRPLIPEHVESMLPDDVPQIHLAEFEGPLDLLLYLIRRDKLDIHDLPIAPITRQYMQYLELMRELNLDVAGEFMVMAATLIHIKSKLLVPLEPTEAEGEEDAEDPREALVRRLLEFERYKEAAGLLHHKREIRSATFTRPETALPKFDDSGEEMLEASLFDLVAAFKEMLDRRKVLVQHEVESEGKSIEQRMDEVLAEVKEGESLEFLELFREQRTKADMIVTFLALLELIRLKKVKVYQRGIFGGIRVFRPVGPPVDGAPQLSV